MIWKFGYDSKAARPDRRRFSQPVLVGDRWAVNYRALEEIEMPERV